MLEFISAVILICTYVMSNIFTYKKKKWLSLIILLIILILSTTLIHNKKQDDENNIQSMKRNNKAITDSLSIYRENYYIWAEENFEDRNTFYRYYLKSTGKLNTISILVNGIISYSGDVTISTAEDTINNLFSNTDIEIQIESEDRIFTGLASKGIQNLISLNPKGESGVRNVGKIIYDPRIRGTPINIGRGFDYLNRRRGFEYHTFYFTVEVTDIELMTRNNFPYIPSENKESEVFTYRKIESKPNNQFGINFNVTPIR